MTRDWLLEQLRPLCLAAGVDPAKVQRIIVDNPRRVSIRYSLEPAARGNAWAAIDVTADPEPVPDVVDEGDE